MLGQILLFLCKLCCLPAIVWFFYLATDMQWTQSYPAMSLQGATQADNLLNMNFNPV